MQHYDKWGPWFGTLVATAPARRARSRFWERCAWPLAVGAALLIVTGVLAALTLLGGPNV